MAQLKLRSDECELDFLSLGALVHRLDPGIIPFRKARSFDIHVSGGEYNVAANLADCFGLKTGVATAMVNYGIGELVQAPRARDGRHAVLQVVRARRRPRPEHRDGLQRSRPRRACRRSCSTTAPTKPARMLKPGDFDWKSDLRRRRASWFHSGGIFAALSPTTSELIIEGMQAAKAAGAITSFDLNYRAKLWAADRRRSQRARDDREDRRATSMC